ncbi:MAG: NAD(+) synthase [Terriglobia bacterium]
MGNQVFGKGALSLDPVAVSRQIEQTLKEQIFQYLKKKGAVVALSGGIDSSVTAALCVRALGKERVFGVMLPERDSSGDSLRLAHLLAGTFGIETVVEDIAPLLEAAGCYRRRDEAIRKQIPEYTENYKSKIAITNPLVHAGMTFFNLVVESPEGKQTKVRLDLKPYLEIVAATNMKQRTRKFFEYYYADRYNYAVLGTPNRLEYDQGFFVKNGDGAADVKPIAHLYKSQVYELAEYLGVPEEICKRPPTTDTYSLAQTQEEFYFSLPYDQMDLCLYGKNHNIPSSLVAQELGLTAEQVDRVYLDIERKRASSRYLHAPPLLVEKVIS